MNTKLTLNIDKGVIENAKVLAKETGTSLSKLIENYLRSLVQPTKNKSAVTPLVKSLTGVMPAQDEEREKDARFDHLANKYS